jgi:hypothetical protein
MIVLLVAALLAQAADGVSFYGMMENGGSELNPIVAWAYEQHHLLPLALKVVLGAYLVYFYRVVRGSGKALVSVLTFSLVIGILGLLSNAYQVGGH